MTARPSPAQLGLLRVAEGLSEPFGVGELWRACYDGIALLGDPSPNAASFRVCVRNGWLREEQARRSVDGEWFLLAGSYRLTDAGRGEIAAAAAHGAWAIHGGRIHTHADCGHLRAAIRRRGAAAAVLFSGAEGVVCAFCRRRDAAVAPVPVDSTMGAPAAGRCAGGAAS